MSESEPLAFVAGATGFTGREVVKSLRSKGVKTVAHVRPDSARLQEWRVRFEEQGAAVDATAWSVDALGETFRKLRPTVIFALLGTTRNRMGQAAKEGKGRESADYEAVDYGMTKMLMDAAVAAGIRPRFVYLSASGSGPRAAGAYMKARWKTESALRSSGLPFTIARPAFIAGDGRDDSRPFEKVGAAFFDTALNIAGAVGAKKLSERYRSISNVTLAGALVRLALDPVAENQVVERESLVP